MIVFLYLQFLRLFNRKKYTKEYIKVRTSGLFDKTYYRNKNPNVKILDEIEHYLNFGWKNNINPSQLFDAKQYLQENPDVKKAKVNPLLHYLKYGKHEGRIFEKEGTIIVHFLSFECDDFGTKISFCSTVENIQLVLNKQIFRPKQLLSIEEISYNKLLNKEGKTLLVYQIGKEIQVKEFFLKKENLDIKIKIKNYNNFRESFFWLEKNKVKKVSKQEYLLRCILSFQISLKHKITGIKNILNKKEYFLFDESRDNANDNAFKLFKKCLSYTDNAYFVTSQTVFDSIKDERLKKHILIRSSAEHINKFLKAKAIISSYFFFDLNFKDLNAIIYPFVKAKLFFVPHGISCDKNSFYLNYKNLGQPDMLFCCSAYEQDYFSTYCGIKNITVSGYPRMDKWTNAKIDYNSIVIFFTWRSELSQKFITKTVELCKEIATKLPEKKINFLLHPSCAEAQETALTDTFKKHKLNVKIIKPFQQNDFNVAFRNSYALITDYSSVAYDFMYSEDKTSIYYAPIAEITPEYNLLDIWHKINLCIKAYSPQDVISILKNPTVSTEIQDKRLEFFKYTDSNNTNRVFSLIEKSCNNPFDKSILNFLKYSELFDEQWYLLQYPEAKKSQNAFKHFMNIGWQKGYNPSEKFSTKLYIQAHPDVKHAGINPLLHYELFGRKESRNIFPLKSTPKLYKGKNNLSQKNILLVSHILNHTGAPILLLQLAKLLKENYYNVYILSPTDGLLKTEFLKIGANVIIDSTIFLINEHLDFYKELNFSFCIFNTSLNAKIFTLFKSFVPSILWIHENIEANNSTELKQMIYDSPNIYVPSKLTYTYAKVYNKNPKILSYPIKDFVKNISEKQISEKLRIALIGTLQERKAQDIFIDAVKKIPLQTRKNAEFLLLGEQTSFVFYQKLKEKSKNVPEIKFLEAIKNTDQYHDFVDSIDILCCPSRADPYPLVVIDALMHGKVIVISTNVGQTELLKDNQAGFIFENENSQQLSIILRNLIDKGVSATQRNSARNLFVNNFSYNKYIKTLENVMEQTCKE